MRSRLPSGQVGLAVSVMVHAAVALFLWRLPAPKPPPAEPVELDVVVAQRPATRIVEPPPAPPPPSPAQAGHLRVPGPAKAEAKRAPKPSNPVAKTSSPAPMPAPVSVPEATPSDPAAASPAPTATASAEPPRDLPRAANLDLTLRSVPDATGGIPVVREQLRLAPSATAPAEKSPSELIMGSQGRRRVENGQVDPYFAQLGKALIDHWDAEAHVRRSGVRGWMQQMSENTEMLTTIWQKNAKRYAQTGNLFSDAEAGTYSIPTVVDRTGGLASKAARDAYDRNLKEQFTARKRALVRVVQNHDGTLRSVTLVEGSNEPSIDRDAVADVQAAASRLPPPPPEGLGIKEPIVSLWEFQLTVSISPPVPTVTVEFDEALAYLDARMPLDRRIYKRVKLVAVE